MSDIVERLREAGLQDGFAVILHQHVIQAADEIERLRHEVTLLEASRKEIIEIDEERVAEIERLRERLSRYAG